MPPAKSLCRAATSIALLASCALVVLVGRAHAQEGAQSKVEELAEMSLEQLLNVPISASTSLSQTAREAPSSVSVVTREQIRAYGWLSLNEILYRQPGFSPSRDYDRRTISARGLYEGWNNNHLLLLVDGLKFNEPLYGSALTSEVTPLVLAQSVEVIRGPGSALYGSNATNGVISINTPDASELPQNAEFRVRYGSQNHLIVDGLAGVDSRYAGIVLAVNSFGTDGYNYNSADGSGRTVGGEPARFRIRDDRTSTYLYAKVQAHGPLQGLELSFHRQEWSFQTGHGWLWATPDFRESMKESRLITTLSYKRDSKWIDQSYAVVHQRHSVDWNMRYFPDAFSAYGNTYPNGVWEGLDTNGDSILAKAQETLHLPREASVLVGLENTLFIYNGDRSHTSNAQLSGDFSPVPGGRTVHLKPWLEWIDDHPQDNLGLYAQLVSGKLLGSISEATLGVRYDRLGVGYTAIDQPGRPDRSRVFQQVSPRAGLVLNVRSDLALKLMVSRAFRAPAPTELAGANTLSLASNIGKLKPEVITSAELGSEWRVITPLALRITAFCTRFEDQIAYSTQGANLSTNLYSLTTTGGEAEALWRQGPLEGFANYSFAYRLGEKIKDPGVSASDGKLTWVPAHVANFGVTGRYGHFTGSTQLHVQGKTSRRKADNATPENVQERGRYVPGWVGLDARLAYAALDWLELDLMINNALDGLFGQSRLIKNLNYPFDYRVDGRRVTGSVSVRY